MKKVYKKLTIMDKNGEYVAITSLMQFWSMVKPINDAHRELIKSTKFYQKLLQQTGGFARFYR